MSEIYGNFDPLAANNNAAPPDGWPENMDYAAVNNTAREDRAKIARWRIAAQSGVKVTAGAGTAYTLTSGQTFSPLTYVTGMTFAFTAHAASGATPTMNIDTMGARNIVDARGVQLGANDLTAGGVYIVNVRAADLQIMGQLTAASLAALLGTNARTPLVANATYFVRTDGNDSNTGLVDSAGGAFLTVQKAIDVVYGTLDLKGFNVDIQVRDGTFGRAQASAPQVGKGTITLRGNSGTPANVILTTTGIGGVINGTIEAKNGAVLFVRDMEVRAITSGSGIVAAANGAVYFQNVRFGTVTAGAQIIATSQGYIEATGDYAIVGSAAQHLWANAVSEIRVQSRTVTLSGTPAFTTFAIADYNAVATINGNTWTGAATGQRFNAHDSGVVVATGGLTELPGNAAGVISTGGVHPALSYQATDAEIRAATTGVEKYVTAGDLESSSAFVTIADAATITVDWDTFICGVVTLTANRALGVPSNAQPGTSRTIRVLGNSGTLRSLSFAGYQGGTATLTDISNAKEYLVTLFAITATVVVLKATQALP